MGVEATGSQRVTVRDTEPPLSVGRVTGGTTTPIVPPPTPPQLGTGDNASFGNYPGTAEPNVVNFDRSEENERPPRPVNFVVTLASVLLTLAQAGTGYNPEQFEATKALLADSARFVSTHGLAYDLSLFGTATPLEDPSLDRIGQDHEEEQRRQAAAS